MRLPDAVREQLREIAEREYPEYDTYQEALSKVVAEKHGEIIAHEEAVESKREELREQMSGNSRSHDETDETATDDVTKKQNEIADKIFGGE